MSIVAEERKVVDAVEKRLYIGGEWRDASGEGTLEVIDPATEEPLCEVADATPEDAAAVAELATVRAALDAARAEVAALRTDLTIPAMELDQERGRVAGLEALIALRRDFPGPHISP